MPNHKKIVIIAGEESGDIHAAALVRRLNSELSGLEITGVGGSHMEDAGVSLISDLARYGVTGITEVIRHLFMFKKVFQLIKAHLLSQKPDLLILVDCPGVNLRIAKFAKAHGIRVLYYISPQIWAWKANRIKTIQACVDKMAVILPFEKEIYEKANVPVSFVGHPLIEKIIPCSDVESARNALNFPKNKRIVAMLPGSRKNEIERHLPVFAASAEKLSQEMDNLHFVIPIARTLASAQIRAYFTNSTISISFIEGRATDIVACCDCAVVASGTASLECALQIKPMCIVYKGAWLSYVVFMRIVKIKFLGLCNLLKNEMIVPELLQDDCNEKELTRTLRELLQDTVAITRMKKRLTQLKHSLSAEGADCTLVDLVKQELLGVGV